MQWLAQLILGPFFNMLVEGYKSKLAATNETGRQAVEIIQADLAAKRERTNAQRDMGILAMNHWVWWVAWGLFVLPVGFYNATIFILSTLSIPPCTGDVITQCFTVLQVPEAQEKLMGDIVESIFLAQGASGIAGALIKRFTK